MQNHRLKKLQDEAVTKITVLLAVQYKMKQYVIARQTAIALSFIDNKT